MKLADKLVKLNSSSRRVLLAALVVVAAAGLYKGILAPFSGQLLAAQNFNSMLDSAMSKSSMLDTTLEEKKTKLEELDGKSARLRNEFFTSNEVQEFFASLPTVIRRAGCAVQSVSQSPEQKPGSPKQQQDTSGISNRKATITFVGGYNNIVRFLKEMQTYKRRVWIDSVRMDTARMPGKLRCQATLTIYCVDGTETALYE